MISMICKHACRSTYSRQTAKGCDIHSIQPLGLPSYCLHLEVVGQQQALSCRQCFRDMPGL